MIQTFDLTIPELSGGELRRAYVWLPDAYDGDPDARFPVLYMFDGQNVFFDEDASFGTSWRMYDYLNAGQPDVIVAAVSCSQTGRMAEYSPFSHENGDAGHVNARGRSTMEWLLGEFKPSIDAQYRTLPDRDNTLIAGSSMGGLMSLYAALDYNGAFSRAACLSPSLWVHPRKSLRMIERARIAP
ncbi:MAG: alpha/beta hydrolase, partial [Candidatus Ventricola sp.]